MTPAEIDWSDGEPPRSRLYGDLYFSRDGGLSESRAVFLSGCGLPDAWAGRRLFTVAELGFGTGLNIVALIDTWRRTRPAGSRLSVFTVESHLMTASQAERALGAWPEVAETAALLLERWPRPTRGFHRIDLASLGVTIDLAAMEVGDALDAWSGRADAWFLDGFSPALNPAMWRGEVMDRIAARSAPGARLATYTVASAVRRDLERVGFTPDRKPGFGRKRERLEGRFAGEPEPAPPPPRVAIVGGGIAAASLRRAFSAFGVDASVFVDPASRGASFGPAALVAPRLDAGLDTPAALFAQAFHRAVDVYGEVAGGVIARGAMQLPVTPDDPRRFAKIAGSDLFDPATTRLVSGPAGDTDPAALRFDEALVVDPAAIAAAWLGETRPEWVAALERVGDVWRLLSEDGAVLAEAEVVIVAAGTATRALLPSLDLGAVRGQASFAEGHAPETALLFGGYAVPTRGGLMFGATHDRGDTSVEPRIGDHGRNRATLAAALPTLARDIADAPLSAHVGLRATTKDFLPLAGPADPSRPGIHVLSGLGSRGFCLAPLLAEHIAALVMGAPSPLPADIVSIVDPGRFERRKRRSRPPAPPSTR